MFPNAYGDRATHWQILLYSIQVVALTLLLPVVQLGGWFYVLVALLLGAGLIFHAWRALRAVDHRLTWKLYRYSNRYLGLIFLALVVDTFI